MSQRKKRLEKLMQHREREVETRLAALAAQRNAEELAKKRVEQEQARLQAAREERLKAISKALDVNSLVLTNDWLLACGRRRELAESELFQAKKAVGEAQQQVVAAKNDLKKIELIAQRLAAEERLQAERAEQRVSDEFAARRFADAEKQKAGT